MSNFASFDFEKALLSKGYSNIVGIDEVGRGAAVSSVVAGAVHIPVDKVSLFIGKLKDSKKLSQKRREELYDLIQDHCTVAFDGVDEKTIDSINILNATKQAMTGALAKLIEKNNEVDYVLIDGPVYINSFGIEQQQIIGGDALCLSIAAASIIAKVVRDNIIMGLHNIYPNYHWDSNKGYLTKSHIEALSLYGPTEFHRLSYNKVINDKNK